jgi:sugar transferase (PEP-CTERM system associated)
MLRIFKKNYPIRNVFFVIGEGIFIYVSLMLASVIILGPHSLQMDRWLFLKILLITTICQTCLYYNDLYDLRITDTLTELGIRLLQALGIAAIFLALIYILFPATIISTGIFIVSTCFVILLIVSWRFCYTVVLNRGMFNQRILLLGSGDLSDRIRKEINERKDCGYSVALEVPECIDEVDFSKSSHVPIICRKNFEGLCELAKDLNIEKIVVNFKEKRNAYPLKELLKCRVEGLDILEGNSFYENLTGQLVVEQINPSWLIFSGGFEKSNLRRFLKRTIDLILSSTLIIFLSPLILLVALLIKIDSRGSVIFSQERVGERRKGYMVHKFRSMVENAEQESGPVWADEQDARITRVGRIIRKLRIDEVPQLWNVLKGEMSFVGPRPEREYFVKDLEDRIPYYGERFTVKPGITGWAQVNYGYGATVEDAIAKLNYDLFYIKNMSTLMDLMIVLRTIKIVLFRKGAR